MKQAQREQNHTSQDPPSPYDPGGVGGLYRSVSLLGIVVASAGVIGELHLGGSIRRGLWSVEGVWSALLSGDPSALTTLGIWILIAGPIMALLSVFYSGIRQRSPTAVFLSGVVLLVIILSVPIKMWLEGGG